MFARLGDRLRVAGTAEINGYSRVLNQARCDMLTTRTRELFPDACDWEQSNFWTGLRPMTPSNIPYIGRMKYANLYLNAGHGTLGWTMGCARGVQWPSLFQAISRMWISRSPEPEAAHPETRQIFLPFPAFRRKRIDCATTTLDPSLRWGDAD